MKIGILFILGLATIMAMSKPGQTSLPQLQLATEQFQGLAAAQTAGYTLTSGHNDCNRSLGGAGYQYVNVGLIDTTVDLEHPEALIYIPNSNGTIQLGAVEYIVPVAGWNAIHKSEWPKIMGQQFHLNSALGVYELHVWTWKDNPSGMFEDWNPKVACI